MANTGNRRAQPWMCHAAWLALALAVPSCRFDLPRVPGADAGGLYLELLAGDIGASGTLDDTGVAARFYNPSGVAVDSTGNIYVADTNNCTIRKVTPVGIVTTLAGSAGSCGSADGTGAEACFDHPRGVAVDGIGNIYVADTINCTIRKVTPVGGVTTLAGSARSCGTVDGMGAEARFSSPYGVAVDSAGNSYVTDRYNHTIRKVTPTGLVTTLAGSAGWSGSTDGTSGTARFDYPAGVAVDSAGNVYVADTNSYPFHRITAAGNVTRLAGTADVPGSTDGVGSAARFNNPSGVAIDGADNLYIADAKNHIIRRITADGTITTIAGSAEREGIQLGEPPRFARPGHLAISGDSIVISDANAILLLRHDAQ